MMQRREFIAGLGGATMWPCIAAAQRRTRLPLIGVLWGGEPVFPMADFRQGLADQGLIIGENVAIDFEFPFQLSQLTAHAAALVERRVDVIVAANNQGTIRAAKASTKTIPIVFAYGGDPVDDGFVASFGRPGGNVTGITSGQSRLTGKRLSILHELVPSATTIAFLTGPGTGESQDRARAAWQSFGFNVMILEAREDPREIERAFGEMTERLVQGLVVDNTTLADTFSRTIVALAERHKIPAIYPFLYLARIGGLISYSTIDRSYYRDVAAQYVAPILKGAKPADLPVQLPTKFALVINLKTAKALGLTIPETLLATADEAIQ
jgi:putative tryptophan/tyrosine transport system substrate-binding protein